MKKTITHVARYVGYAGLAALICALPSIIHASGTITGTQTVGNIGINDQTDATSTIQANVANVLATRTLTANSLPAASTTSTIGSCVITYTSTVTATTTSCASNAVLINIATSSTASLLAANLRVLTNVSDNVNGHGALTIGGSGTTVTFTTSAAAEASSSVINFTDGTTGAVTSSASTSGTVPKTQQNRVTIGGTPEVGDVFSIGLPTGTTTYTTVASDTSLTNIAGDIAAAITASTTYSGQAFTVTTASNLINFIAKTAGTGFTTINATTTNASPVAQVVQFTIPNIDGAATYTIVINGTTYTDSDTSGNATTILGNLAASMASDGSVTCAVSGTTLTCTAKSAGTAFTYSASAASNTSTSSGGGGGGGGGGYSSNSSNTTSTVSTGSNTSTITATPVSYPSGISEKITKTLKYGQENNSVKILQTLLSADPSLGFNSKVTGYFGLKTRAAVEAFQVKYHIVTPGLPGYGSLGPKTRAMLVQVFG